MSNGKALVGGEEGGERIWLLREPIIGTQEMKQNHRTGSYCRNPGER